MKNIPAQSVDVIITDPPYASLTSSCSAVSGKDQYGSLFEGQFYEAWIREHMKMWLRVLKATGAIWMTIDWRGALCIEEAAFKLKLRKPKVGVWYRKFIGMGDILQNTYECFLILPMKEWNRKKANEPDVWEHGWGPGNRRFHHRAEKPVELMKRACDLLCPKEGTILDPFMGSGTTGIAAIQGGYRFIGIEKDQSYFEVAQKRMTQEAFLQSSGILSLESLHATP